MFYVGQGETRVNSRLWRCLLNFHLYKDVHYHLLSHHRKLNIEIVCTTCYSFIATVMKSTCERRQRETKGS